MTMAAKKTTARKPTKAPKPMTYKTFSALAKASVDGRLPRGFRLAFDGGTVIASHGIRFEMSEQDLMKQALAMFGIKTDVV
jgi:hypothetical protein